MDSPHETLVRPRRGSAEVKSTKVTEMQSVTGDLRSSNGNNETITFDWDVGVSRSGL